MTGPLLLSPLLRLAQSLRDAGVPVSTSELLDATAALEEIDVTDRGAVRAALAASMVKQVDDIATFGITYRYAIWLRRPPTRLYCAPASRN